MSVKVEVVLWKRRRDRGDRGSSEHRTENPECVAEHDPLHREACERTDVFHDVVWRVAHPAGPVFQVHVERHPLLLAVLDGPPNVIQVLLWRPTQLLLAVQQRTFRQKIDDSDPGAASPVDRCLRIDKSEYFDPVAEVFLFGPADDVGDRHAFSCAGACRCDLDPVDLDLQQESAGNRQLLCRYERHAFSLLAVAERGVEHFDEPRPRSGLTCRSGGHGGTLFPSRRIGSRDGGLNGR